MLMKPCEYAIVFILPNSFKLTQIFTRTQRLRQKQLTLQYLENEAYKPYIIKFFYSVSRKLLADLLVYKTIFINKG